MAGEGAAVSPQARAAYRCAFLRSSLLVRAFLTQGAPRRLRYSLGVRPVVALKAREKCWGDENPSELAIEAAVARLPDKADCAIHMRSSVV